MVSTDAIRIAVGVVVLVATAIGGFLVYRNVTAAPPVDTRLNSAVLMRGAEMGVDLTNGRPDEDQERLLGVFDEGKTTLAADLTFRDGLYVFTENEAVFSGYLADTFDNGEPRVIACVVDGRLQGPSVELFPDRSLKVSRNNKDGEAVGQMLEFFPDGVLKLRVMMKGQSPNGGALVGEITARTYEDGAYEKRELGTGRLQFIDEGGGTDFRNADTALEDVAGFMLFYDGLMGQKVYTSDSRGIESAPVFDSLQESGSDG